MITRIYRFLDWVSADRREAAANAAFRAAFATENGRIALAAILRMGRVHRAMAHPARDARADAYVEGQRALAIAILTRAGCDPDRLPEALIRDRLEEMTDDRTDRDAAGRAERDGEPRAEPRAGRAGSSAAADPDISFGD